MKNYLLLLIEKAETAWENEDGIAFKEAMDAIKVNRGKLDQLPSVPDADWIPNLGTSIPKLKAGTFEVLFRRGSPELSTHSSDRYRWTIEGSSADIIAYKPLQNR